MPYPTKPKGGWQRPRQVVVNKSTAQIWEKKATQKFANKYKEIFQNNMAEGQNDPQGPFFYQEGGKTYASLPLGMKQGIQQSPLFEKMQKDCKAEGIKLPKNIMVKDPRTHMLMPQEYLRNVEAGVIIGKTLPLNFLPGVYPLKNFANKTLPGVSEINFFNQMRNPPPSWENPPHRYCDVILHCLKILKIDQSSQALQRNLLALHCFTIEHL